MAGPVPNPIDRLSDKDKYKAFRQFMFNELGITKEDIRVWIREAVGQQVETVVKREADRLDVGKIARQQFKMVAEEMVKGRGYNNKTPSFLVTAITAQIMDRLEIKVKK